jgi:hypothetical protein
MLWLRELPDGQKAPYGAPNALVNGNPASYHDLAKGTQRMLDWWSNGIHYASYDDEHVTGTCTDHESAAQTQRCTEVLNARATVSEADMVRVAASVAPR